MLMLMLMVLVMVMVVGSTVRICVLYTAVEICNNNAQISMAKYQQQQQQHQQINVEHERNVNTWNMNFETGIVHGVCSRCCSLVAIVYLGLVFLPSLHIRFFCLSAHVSVDCMSRVHRVRLFNMNFIENDLDSVTSSHSLNRISRPNQIYKINRLLWFWWASNWFSWTNERSHHKNYRIFFFISKYRYGLIHNIQQRSMK